MGQRTARHARARHLHVRSAGPGLLQQRHPMLTVHAMCSTKCPQEKKN
jgi:hypothetical protein